MRWLTEAGESGRPMGDQGSVGEAPGRRVQPAASGRWLREDAAPALPAAFLICPDAYAMTANVALWGPAVTLQSFQDAGAASVRAALEFALVTADVRALVVCGHARCMAVRPGPEGPCAATQAAVLAQTERLLLDGVVGPRLRDGRVRLEALWFDEQSGDIHRLDPRERRFVPLDELGLMRLLVSMNAGDGGLAAREEGEGRRS